MQPSIPSIEQRIPPDTAWSRGPVCAAPSGGLHEAFARVARERPRAVALLEGERAMSYEELDRTADSWAAQLVALGAGEGEIVPLVLPRGTDLVVALLAVLKTGAAYALLDPSWPRRRLGEIRAELDPPLVIAAPAAHHPLGDPALPVWSPGREAAAAPTDFTPVPVDASAPACVFFTSGTTGRPKGVLTPHRATARLFPRGPGGFADFTAETVMPLAAPVAWDAFSLELWSVLLNGGTSLIVSEPYLSPAALRDGTKRHGTDTVWLTSSLFNMVVDEDPDAFGGLRQVLVGGERLSVPHVRRFLDRHPGVALLNGYGPVESTVFTTTHRITPADCLRPGGIPLGRPVPGTQVHVLEPGGSRRCGVGEIGELCVAGDGLALEYLGAPALTHEKFPREPLGPGSAPTRVYRSGDLVEWDADGLLHFRGRADRQVKIRGHRIEPAEVERQIERLLPGVRSCRVLARPDASGDAQELLAFCRPVEPGDPLPDALDVLRSALVAYQRPARVIGVDVFPVTAQGKLDERAMLELADGTAPVRPTAGAADDRLAYDRSAENAVLRAVADAFAAVLERDRVPLDVPFTGLGGTSLGAGRVCARLASRLGRPVPVSCLYLHPTAEALAHCLCTTAEAEPDAPARQGPTPLTPMQTVYLTRQLVAPADRTGHCLVTWVIEGPLDHAALRRAVAAVHERHEALRAAYLPDPRPSAVPVDIPAPEVELLPREPSVHAAVRALRTELSDELLLTAGEVWRTALVPVRGAGPGGTAVFGCVVHHIAFDGYSESVLAHDLAAAYAHASGSDGGAAAAPAPPSLAALHTQRARQHRLVAPDAAHEAYAAELTGVPELRWPPPRLPGPAGPDRMTATVSATAMAGVDRLAGAAGVTRFAALLCLWGASLAQVTEERDFTVGVPVSRRDGAGLDQVVGCHIDMVCLRLRGAALDGDVAAVGAVGRVAARAFAAQDLSLPGLLARVGPPRTGRHPLYQALFALQDNPAPHLDLPGTRTRFVRQPYVELPLDLHTECWPDADGGLRVEFAFRPDRVPREVASALAEQFTARLHALGGARYARAAAPCG